MSALRTGSRVGVYEVQERLGSGGMAEVYRARDTNLGRDVALKLLPEELASDDARLRRFALEARSASALNHPNIVTIYDAGTHGSVPFIAMELVEGRTLREVLAAGALPPAAFLDVAIQLADGLARAHAAGIVHRDLKPENVMLGRGGLVKILDFGLAKRTPFEGGAGSDTWTLTQEGTVLGTVGYMSPEQAGGQAVDFRSDQFSFGTILYEMATGSRAFQRGTGVETLAAIINTEPEPIETRIPDFPWPLRWTVVRCLAKHPARRYASTEDLAEELRLARERLPELRAAAPAVPPARSLRRALLAVLAIGLLALAAAFLLGRRAGERPMPDYVSLTKGRGTVSGARFAPDGRTVVYGAAWDGDPIRLFTTRTDSRESAPISLPDADVVSVSSQGELAILLGRPLEPVTSWTGTLARAPLAGGAPRELTEAVSAADWAPDGNGIAIARKSGARYRVEYPIGTVLHETAGYVPTLRFSPKGDRLAFIQRSSDEGGGVSVETVDLGRNHRVLSKGWKRGRGLAFTPDGDEIWFTANEEGWRVPLMAVTLSGKQRLLLRLPPGILQLTDIAPDGRVLLSVGALRWTTRARRAGDAQERDFSWNDASLVKRLTPDGRTILFDEGSEGYFHTVYVRPTDGSAATRLAAGTARAISADGRWVAANAAGRGSPLWLLPTGAGDARPLDVKGHRVEEAEFFPDGKRLLLLARDTGHDIQTHVLDLTSGELRRLAPEGVACLVPSPDGREAACTTRDRKGLLYPVDEGEPRPIAGMEAGDAPITWSADGTSLYVGARRRGSDPLRIFRLHLGSGARELAHELVPPDKAGLVAFQVSLTPDGRSYAYSCMNAPSILYLVSGLK